MLSRFKAHARGFLENASLIIKLFHRYFQAQALRQLWAKGPLEKNTQHFRNVENLKWK
jgi:hypothetical protein